MSSRSVVLLAGLVIAVLVGGYFLFEGDSAGPQGGAEQAGTVQQPLDDTAESSQEADSASRVSSETETETAEPASDGQDSAEPSAPEQATAEPEPAPQASDAPETTADGQEPAEDVTTDAATSPETTPAPDAETEAPAEAGSLAAPAERQDDPSQPTEEATAAAERPSGEDTQAVASQEESDSLPKQSEAPAAEESDSDRAEAETQESQAADTEPSGTTTETAMTEPAAEQSTTQKAEEAQALAQREQEAAAETVVAALPKAPLPEGDETAGEEQDEQAEPGASPPSFDVVRIERDGALVAAGRSPRGSRVFLLRDGKVEAEAEADRRGNWVLILDRPLPPGDHELLLEARLPSGETIRSSELVVASVPREATGDDRTHADAGETGQAPSDESAGTEEAVAIAVPQEGGGARVLQGQNQEENEGLRTLGLSILSVDYDAEGFIKVAGRGLPGATVLAYLDNALIGRTEVAADERWLIEPEEAVEEGLYQLRVDQVNDAGEVVARLETVFARTLFIADLPLERMVVVEPGNSLWRLARRLYGEGILYSVIYDANQDQIRDPDLIYPGQIFLAPRQLPAN